MDDGPPPPPPPHGANPEDTAGTSANEEGRYRKPTDLPDGPYDIFIVPPHSSGSGFLYLPSLQCHRNSFLAGVGSTLGAVLLYINLLPVFKMWFSTVMASGSMGVSMLVIGVAVAAWSLGRTQFDTGKPGKKDGDGVPPRGGRGPRGPRGPPPPGGGPGGAGAPPPGGQQYPNFGGAYPGGGFGGAQGPGGPYPGGQYYGGPNAGPPPQPPPRQHASGPPPDPAEEFRRADEEKARKAEAEAKAEQARKAKEAETARKAREAEETARKTREAEKAQSAAEARRAREAEDAARRSREAKEARKAEEARKAREAEEAARKAREAEEAVKAEAEKKRSDWEKAREETRRKEEIKRKMDEYRKKKTEEEARKKEEDERKSREEQQKRDKESREQSFREWKEKRANERSEKEAAEKAEAEKAAKEKARQEAAARYAAAKEAAAAKRAAATSQSSPSTVQPSSPEKRAPKTPSPQKKPHGKTAAEDDAYSFRPYDRARSSFNRSNAASSIFSESSYAPSQSTAQTTPPPRRGPYTTADPDKVIIHGVYAFNNAFMKTPIGQLVSGKGQVTDGLILRITTEGMFVDDDVRGVPQREWDVKAWTMKLVEVWCPLHGWKPPQRPSAASKSNPFRFGMSIASPKPPTGPEADAFLNGLLTACKNQCRLKTSSRTGASRGYHVVRASLRDQEGKNYIFVLQETEAWKVAVGLQRLRGSSQIRNLGVCGLASNETTSILGNLGF